MMSAAVKGKTLDEVQALTRAFKGMMSIHEQALDGEDADGPADADPEVKLGDLEALRGVVKFPVRIKCATLSWNTLLQALDEPRRRVVPRRGRLHGRVEPAFDDDERTMLAGLPRLPPRHAGVEGLRPDPGAARPAASRRRRSPSAGW